MSLLLLLLVAANSMARVEGQSPWDRNNSARYRAQCIKEAKERLAVLDEKEKARATQEAKTTNDLAPISLELSSQQARMARLEATISLQTAEVNRPLKNKKSTMEIFPDGPSFEQLSPHAFDQEDKKASEAQSQALREDLAKWADERDESQPGLVHLREQAASLNKTLQDLAVEKANLEKQRQADQELAKGEGGCLMG